MPGLTGTIPDSGAVDTALSESFHRAVRIQLHEPGYRHRILALPGGGTVARVDAGIDWSAGGLFQLDDLSCVVAWSGYFDDPSDNAPARAESRARKLATSFLRAGPHVLRELDGSFALFIHDYSRKRSLLAVDHNGSRPVFYCRHADGFCFAAEPGGIVEMLGAPPQVRVSAIASFLVNGHLLRDDSFFESITPLLPGRYVLIEEGRVRADHHWVYRIEPADADRGEAFYGDALADLLQAAVRRAVDRAPDLVLPLSGGYDSRGILGCMMEILPADAIRTVTWGVVEDAPGSDAQIARSIAQRLHLDHRFVRRESSRLADDVGPMLERSQGLTNDPCIHHGELRIMQALRGDTGASGILRGDECFGFGGETSTDTEALRRVAIGNLATLPSLHSLFQTDVLPDALAASARTLAEITDACPASNALDRKDWFYFTQRLTHYLNRSTYYKQTVLEVVNPWLDRGILEFMGRVPRHYRIDKILYRNTLARRFPSLFRDFPIASSASLENWSSVIASDRDLQRFIRRHLVEERNGLHDLFDPEAMDRLLAGTIRGSGRPSSRQRATAAAKRMLARWPAAYRLIKTRLIARVAAPALPSGETLLRLLQLKLFFDRLSGSAVLDPVNATQRQDTPASSASAP